MPKQSAPKSKGLHTPVSNQPPVEISEVPKKSVVEAPSSGPGAKVSPGHAGVEDVKGHSKPERALAECFTAHSELKLPDIGEASFGRPSPTPETVHGPDDRVQITNTSVYPWRAHASLEIVAADGSRWIGTGWFVGPHTLATAGHVVYIKNSGVPGQDGWVRSIKVMPGRNGSSLPYGAVTSTNFRSVTGWTQNGDRNYDYGAIILPKDLGSTVGWFGFGAFSDADILSAQGNISGYPGDKPSGTQWYDHHKIASVDARRINYDIDTFGGQSGSALYKIVEGNRYGMGVHTYGGATTNSATRIVVPAFNNYVAWKT